MIKKRCTKHSLLLLAGVISLPLAAQENSMFSNQLFTDSSLDFSTRNMWKYLNEEETGKKNIHSAWGQGITLDYKSGYLADMIGMDASYYGVIKLGASDYFASRGILFNDGRYPGANKDNASGFNKVGQLYGKMKAGDDTLGANLYGGWKTLNKFGALTTSNRAAPNSYLGWSGDINFDAYRLRLAYVTSSYNRDSPDKVSFATNDGQSLTYIFTGDVRYKSENLTAQYFYGESKDYLQRHGLETEWNALKKLQIGTQIYGTEGQEKWKSMAASKQSFDDSAWHYAVDAHWKEKDWFTKVGVAYTDANKTNGIGQFPRHISKNSRGTFNSMATAGLDYMRDGETTFSLATGYNLTPELTTGIYANYAFFNFENQSIHESEVNLYARWVPSQTQLKGLSVFVMAGPGWTYQQQNYRPIRGSDGEVQRAKSLAAELVIDYKFSIF